MIHKGTAADRFGRENFFGVIFFYLYEQHIKFYDGANFCTNFKLFINDAKNFNAILLKSFNAINFNHSLKYFKSALSHNFSSTRRDN